jgi:hypothetical protein
MNAVSNIAKQLKKSYKMSAMDINNGYCAQFAKELVKSFGRGEIIYTKNFELLDELENFENKKVSEYKGKDNGYSHCYALIDGKRYDAFNCAGKTYESEMTFRKIVLDRFGYIDYVKK